MSPQILPNPQTTATVLFRPFRRFRRSFRSSSYQLRPTSFPSPRFSFPLLHLEQAMHLQSQSSVPGFSWQDDSSRLASPFPLGSNALAFVVNDSLSRTIESEVGGGLGQGWAAFMVLLRLCPQPLLKSSLGTSLTRCQCCPPVARYSVSHHQCNRSLLGADRGTATIVSLCVSGHSFFFPSFPFSFPSSILWKRAWGGHCRRCPPLHSNTPAILFFCPFAYCSTPTPRYPV